MRKCAHLLVMLSACLGALIGPAARPAYGLDLIMFEASWCGYCKQFKREVEPNYRSTRIGRQIPLRLVRVGGNVGFKLRGPVSGYPTFVLVDHGVEVARFSGYDGASDFYQSLADAASRYLR